MIRFMRFLTLIIIIFSGQLKAQNEAIIHFDKPFYVTGEVVYFSAYLNKALPDDAVFNCSLLDRSGKILQSFYLANSTEDQISGYIKIPYSIDSDYYGFRIDAFNKATKIRANLASAPIAIYNDLKSVPSSVKLLESFPAVPEKEGTVNIGIGHSKMVKKAGVVEVNIDVGSTEATGVASVSVVPKSSMVLPNIISSPSEDLPTVVENRILVDGKLYDNNGDPLIITVLGMYSPAEAKFHYTKSYEEGRLSAVLPNFTGEKQIQFVGYQFEEEIVDARLQTSLPTNVPETLPYSQNILDFLESSRMRKKIYQYFGGLEYTLESKSERIKPQELKPQFRYKFQEYEPFENVAGFFGELITPLKFELTEDSTYISIMDNPSKFSERYAYKQTTRLDGNPLFIVDGYVTRDADFVARLDYNIIDEVELYFRPKELRSQFNALGSSGVIIVRTNQDNINLPKEDARNVHMINGFQEPIINTEKELIDGQPNLKSVQYWAERIEVSNGKANFSFQQSDDFGDFIIQVVYQGADGKWGSNSSTYTVENTLN